MRTVKQKFIILATIIVLLNGIMLVSCQKESVTKKVKTQKTEVSANERTAGSTWTYGEPAYYDEFGLPRWNESYPRIEIASVEKEGQDITALVLEKLSRGETIPDDNLLITLFHFYSLQDYSLLTDENNRPYVPVSTPKGTWCQWIGSDCNDPLGTQCQYPCVSGKPCDCLPIIDMPSSGVWTFKQLNNFTGTSLQIKTIIREK